MTPTQARRTADLARQPARLVQPMLAVRRRVQVIHVTIMITTGMRGLASVGTVRAHVAWGVEPHHADTPTRTLHHPGLRHPHP